MTAHSGPVSTRAAARNLIGRALLIPLLVVGCRGHAPPTGRDVILIVVDTLRADALGVYGNPNGNSPTIDAFAAEGVAFRRAISQAPWTQPAIASLFSSVHPSVHGVNDFDYVIHAQRGLRPRIAVFPDKLVTLAEALQSAGYETAGFVANPYLRAEYGFAQGFDHYDSSFAGGHAPGSMVNDAALRWLRRRSGAKPRFLYLHYMDVHGPYYARPEYLEPRIRAFGDLPRKTELDEEAYGDLRYLLGFTGIADDELARHKELSRYREYWVARYEAGVRELDQHLADLRRQLEEMGLWKTAYVIITADHGEELYDHGLWDHGDSLYDTELHVPLILRWPGRLPAGQKIDGLVRLIDLYPTLLDQLGIDPPPGIGGRSVAFDLDDGVLQETPVLAEAVKLRPESKAVYAGRWKMIRASEGQTLLYDTEADPLERSDLSPRHPDRLEHMQRLLEEQIAIDGRRATVEAGHVELTGEEVERLRALGYME